jgi:DNA-binding PadR family transcriptional regulator
VELRQSLGDVSSGDAPRVELLPGTLDLIVLRTLTTMGPQHAYGIAARLEQLAEQSLRLNQGALYPALVRLEQRGRIKGSWQIDAVELDYKLLR